MRRRASVGVLVLVLSGGCVGYRHMPEGQRLASPDGRVEAVIVNLNPDATAIWEFLVYVVPAGASVRRRPTWLGGDEPVLTGTIFASDFTYGWIGPQTLCLTYSNSRIHSFRSTWSSRKLDGGKYVVPIRLRWQEEGEGHGQGWRARQTPSR